MTAIRPFLVVLALAAAAAAQESAEFLTIGVGARALGMAGAQTAIADDLSAIHWNPAGLGNLQKRELAGMHAQLGGAVRHDFFGLAYPTTQGTLGLGMTHLGQDSLQRRDENGKLIGGYSANDTALTLGLGRPWGERLRLGGNVKFIRSSIGAFSGQTLAMDLGGLYQLPKWGVGSPQLGIALQNMGPDMSLLNQGSPLPLTLAAGLGYRVPQWGAAFAFDVKHRPRAGTSEVSLGTEYAVLPSFVLRAGYASNPGPLPGSTRTAGMTGFTTGFGLKVLDLRIDYSVTPFGGLGNAQRFSLGGRF